MAKGGVLINLGLMVLNLIPIPPLDGGRIAVSLLPHRLAYRFAMIEPYGLIIIVVLLATRALGAVIWPLVTLCRNVIYALFGLS
jgi:Zn-dependent protease